MTEQAPDAPLRAYRALSVAADRIGANGYSRGLRAHLKAGRKTSTYRYAPTDAHLLIVEAMPRVLAGEITPDEAMSYLHNYDVLNERTG